MSIFKQISGLLLILFIIDGLRSLPEDVKLKIGLVIAYLTSGAILVFLIKLVTPISDSIIRKSLMKKYETRMQLAQANEAHQPRRQTPVKGMDIWTPSRKEIIAYLLTPDSKEIALFIMGFIIAVTAFKAYTLQTIATGYFIFYWGITEIFIFYYRWGYVGINHLFSDYKKTTKKMQEKEINNESTYNINLKIPGLLASTIIFAWGFAIT